MILCVAPIVNKSVIAIIVNYSFVRAVRGSGNKRE